MTRLAWDQIGERQYETGVNHGVLYIPNGSGAYPNGYAWNGLTTVTESPSGAEANPQYADNIKYLNLYSAEEFGGTIEAFTYPEEFAECDGTAVLFGGLAIGQQSRKAFGLAYRTLIGNDVDGSDHGYKITLVYGGTASPSEKARATVNESPEALAFSWDFTTTKVEVGTINGVDYKPTATIVLNSTTLDADAMSDLIDILYGTEGQDPRLPLPAEVIALFSGTVTVVTPTAPTYNNTTHTITIPTVTGVQYLIDGIVVTGSVVITEDTVVTALPTSGHTLPENFDNDWGFDYS